MIERDEAGGFWLGTRGDYLRVRRLARGERAAFDELARLMEPPSEGQESVCRLLDEVFGEDEPPADAPAR